MSDRPKSAYEVAMEKLRAQDKEHGEAPGKPLTTKQKERIAEVRKHYESKVAEREILYHAERKKAPDDPDKVGEIERSYLTDRRRLESERDAKIEKIRG